MKVGILTFIHTNNFGANLQCLALQQIIEREGFEVDVIDLYRPIDKGYMPCEEDNNRFAALYEYKSVKDYRSKVNKVIARFLKNIKKLIKPNNSNISRKNGFEDFHNQYIHFSEKTYMNFSQLYQEFNEDEYSHLIVGSDQVWNYASGFSKEPFFLTFASKPKKISYAASLGHSTIPNKVSSHYQSWLNDYYAISVREDNAVAAISKLTEKSVEHVLDPTLLLCKDDWLQLLSIQSKNTNGYVLVYMLSVSSPALKLAQDIASKLGCNVKVITSRPYYKKLENVEFLRGENPRSFVELYSNASFVVTNSYHGTAFAVNFNIPFVTVSKKGARLNSRKSSLFKMLDLQSREVFEGEKYDVENLLSCNFDNTNSLLEKERVKSMSFLAKSLNQ